MQKRPLTNRVKISLSTWQTQAKNTVPKQRNTPACINYTFDSAEKLNLTKAFVVVLKW